MKRVWPFLVLGVVVLALVVALRALERQRTPDWRVALDAYIGQSGDPSLPERVTIQFVDRASRPRNFGPHLARPVPLDWQWTSIELPWPPEELVCVLVKRVRYEREGTPETTTYGVLYVARHSDLLWRDGWVVHEGLAAPFSPQLEQDLSSVGCDLELERFRHMEDGILASALLPTIHALGG